MRSKNFEYYSLLILSATIFLCSLMLSFTNLTNLGEKAGIPDSVAFLFPFSIDLLILLGTGIVFSASWEGVNCGNIKGVIFLAVITSMFFNLANGIANPIYQAVLAVPPISQYLALEVGLWYIFKVIHKDHQLGKDVNDPVQAFPQMNPQKVSNQKNPVCIDKVHFGIYEAKNEKKLDKKMTKNGQQREKEQKTFFDYSNNLGQSVGSSLT